ncbi:MAG: UDP-N-acetylmuramate--L-alanine ligase [Acidobacteriota bacterium]|nr:UDP-N-acetylmuramate--L-alanine ligase [Acidobacteriota bacterium]
MTELRDARRVHVVGVAGAGMSAIARLLLERGAVVSGSDRHDVARLRELRAHGASVVVGHDPAAAAAADLVLWSPAVREDDPDLVAARAHGARLLARADLFAQLSDLAPVVGLCGTHGKTTSTSMLIHVARAARRELGWLVGADVTGVGANGHWGDDGLIVEVDESYGTFAKMTPAALGILNIEADHLDHYGSLLALEAAFVALARRTRGPVVGWSDDEGVARVARELPSMISVGTRDADWLVRDVHLERRGARFTLVGPSATLHLRLAVTGAHNVANAAVVAVLALAWGFDAAAVRDGLAAFTGAPRRFQYRGHWRDADVYEDYAHLPGEIAATLRATLAIGYERPLVVFQPHRVSRTVALAADFATCFTGATRVLVTDLYDAGEANPDHVTGEVVVRRVRDVYPDAPISYVGALANVTAAMAPYGDADVVLLLGAGDVGSVLDDVVRP